MGMKEAFLLGWFGWRRVLLSTPLTPLRAVPISHPPVEASGYGNNVKLLFRAPGNPGDVRLDNVIDPVLSDEHWLNPCTPV